MKRRGARSKRADSKPKLTSRFAKAVVFYNPTGTSSSRSKRMIAELKDLLSDKKVLVVETSPKGVEENKKLIERTAKKFDKKTAVFVAGGDGTTSLVLETLLTSKNISAETKKVPVTPLWGGNANDLAYMINGIPSKAQIKMMLEKGKVIPIYPLNIKIVSDSQTENRIAACNASFGASAYAAQQIELPKHKKIRLHLVPAVRLLAEAFIVLRSVFSAASFNIEMDQQKKVVYEHLFVNGSRMAKIGKLPIKLNDKAFYEIIFTGESPSMLDRLQAIRSGKNGKTVKTKRTFILEDEAWAQFDGEVTKLPKNTLVEISLSTVPFYTLSTKLS